MSATGLKWSVSAAVIVDNYDDNKIPYVYLWNFLRFFFSPFQYGSRIAINRARTRLLSFFRIARNASATGFFTRYPSVKHVFSRNPVDI